ncbi:hypothetical protein SLNWT_2657 [Streptomyces albus]|uniref:Uncharacterized protein n=1 Tax=Streptomyces albus (strain ATCC 21838 / DSM 41398 / FERM P-419 / JCM 4703 / NBRC 107858) TaxID=1081613 RepID=A0A0B5EL10_STRA4|nr:hypothetical protein SLNWT_2657 [Streptomyces albus]AOU77343.1 hypothetical protein SLNHY_2652 [Streptomyces albus]AYN33119.1 hypothetical protein DUI70_2618 [Streptomyces albus]
MGGLPRSGRTADPEAVRGTRPVGLAARRRDQDSRRLIHPAMISVQAGTLERGDRL